MKKNKISILIIWLVIGTISPVIHAQVDFILDPSQMIPSDSGYYIQGAYADENKDGILEWYNQCFDAYESYDLHKEFGTQQGYTYMNCLIMPTCDAKYASEDSVSTGYIQMMPCFYTFTDSAIMGAIISPAFKNLKKIYLETSPDVSINTNRKIPYNIDFSKDYGTTWEDAYIFDEVQTQSGYKATYDENSGILEFKDMVSASKETNIVLRFSTNDYATDRPYGGQYVKVHKIIITADEPDAVNISHVQNETESILVSPNRISSDTEQLYVFSITGQFIDSGQSIFLKNGIYIVKTSNGKTKKVIIY